MNARRTIKIATAGLSLSLAAFGVAGCSGGGSKGSLKKFCADYVNMANSSQMQTLVNDSNNGDLTAADPAGKKELKEVAKSMQKLANDAPSAIRDEAQASAKGLKEMASGKADETVQEAGSAAGDHVDAFAQDQCPGATAAATHANATPTTQPTDSFGLGTGTSSIDNGSDSTSYNDNGSDGSSYNDNSSDSTSYNDNSSDGSSYNDNSSDTSIENGSESSSCDDISVAC
jgi:hypothetical protein